MTAKQATISPRVSLLVIRSAGGRWPLVGLVATTTTSKKR